MSSENKTPNLELNQWNGNEYPKRIDFIEDNKKIDDAYKELKDSIKDGGKVSSVNGKIGDVVLKAKDIKTESGDTVQSQMAEITKFNRKTYEELKTLKDNNQLQEGKKYLLTDYRTKYQQPTTNVIKEMDVEGLILTASSNSTFESIVFSTKFPSDIIWYDFDNNVCEDNTTTRNGFILRRYDPISKNDAPQDWRSMLWARYKPHNGVFYLNGVKTGIKTWNTGQPISLDMLYKADNKLWMAKNKNTPTSPTDTSVFYEVYPDLDTPLLINEKTKIAKDIELMRDTLVELPTFGDNCVANNIESTEEAQVIELQNNVFIGNSNYNSLSIGCVKNSFFNSYRNELSQRCYSNIFIASSNNSFGIACYGNFLPSGFNTNTFGNSCSNNTFGNGCNQNNFGNGCNNNSFGSSCYNNGFGNSCYGNIFGNYCYYNTFGNACYRNNFGDYSTINTFASNCFNNTFDSCSYNSFGNSFYDNKAGVGFSYNSFGNGCTNNTFGNHCAHNAFGNSNVKNIFGGSCDNNTFLNSCTDNNILSGFSWNTVKALSNKTLNVGGVLTNGTVCTIQRTNHTGRYVYWYVHDSNSIQVNNIP